MIQEEDAKRNGLGTTYKEAMASSFDDSKWVFDENSTVCSMCGQTLPTDKIESLKTDFEHRKADAKSKFETEKAKRLETIKTDGYKFKNHIEELKKKNEELQKKIDDNKAIETSS